MSTQQVTVGQLQVVISAQIDGYRNQMNQAQNQTRRFVNSINSMMGNIKRTIAGAFAVGAMVSFGKSCIELGSDLAEVQNVVDVVFSSMSDAIDDFAKNAANTFGLSETMAKKFAGTFGAMASSFGFTEQEAYNMATALTGLAGDVASFYNISQDEAYIKLKSVFSGETETLKDLGIVMTENALNSYAQAQGINATVSAMTEQEKVALRYQFVLEQLTFANGDFARTSNSWANQVRILSLQFDSLRATVGQGLINAFLPVIKVLNVVIQRLQIVAIYFKKLTEIIFGHADASLQTTSAIAGTGDSLKSVSDNASKASSNVDKNTKSVKKATTAAKKAKKEIAGLIGGLDEINNINVSETAGTNPSSGSTTPKTSSGSGTGDLLSGLGNIAGGNYLNLADAIDTSGIDAKLEKFKVAVENFKAWLKNNKEKIIAIFAGLVAGVGSYFAMTKWGTFVGTVKQALSPMLTFVRELAEGIKRFGIRPILQGFFSINPVAIAVSAVIAAVVSSLVYLWQTNEDFRNNVIATWNAIKKALAPWLEALKELFLLLADIVGTILVAAFKAISKVVVKVVEVFSNGLLNIIQLICPDIENLGQAFLAFVRTLSKTWKQLKEYFKSLKQEFEKNGIVGVAKKLFTDIGKMLMQGLLNGITFVLSGVANFLSNYVFKPIVNGIKKLFGIHSPSTVMAEIGRFIIEGLKKGMIALLVKLPSQIIKSLKKLKTKVLNTIKKLGFNKAVKEALNKIINSVLQKIKDLKDKTIDKIKTEFNKIKDSFIEKWDEIKDSVKDFVLNIGAKVEDFKEKVIEKWGEVTDIAKDFILNIASKIEDLKEKVIEKWNNAKDYIKDKILEVKSKVESIYEKAKDTFNNAKDYIKDKILEAKSKVESIYEKAKSTYNSAKDYIKEKTLQVKSKVQSIYEKVKSSYNSAKDYIKNKALKIGIKVTSAVGSVKNMVNSLIDTINSKVIAKLDFKVKAPSWLGGGTFGWKAPRIPRLAKGGMIDSPTIAMIGEAGKEVVLPLENNTQALDLIASKLASKIGYSNSTSLSTIQEAQVQEVYNGDVVIKLDGNTVFREKIIDLLRQLKRQGIPVF